MTINNYITTSNYNSNVNTTSHSEIIADLQEQKATALAMFDMAMLNKAVTRLLILKPLQEDLMKIDTVWAVSRRLWVLQASRWAGAYLALRMERFGNKMKRNEKVQVQSAQKPSERKEKKATPQVSPLHVRLEKGLRNLGLFLGRLFHKKEDGLFKLDLQLFASKTEVKKEEVYHQDFDPTLKLDICAWCSSKIQGGFKVETSASTDSHGVCLECCDKMEGIKRVPFKLAPNGISTDLFKGHLAKRPQEQVKALEAIKAVCQRKPDVFPGRRNVATVKINNATFAVVMDCKDDGVHFVTAYEDIRTPSRRSVNESDENRSRFVGTIDVGLFILNLQLHAERNEEDPIGSLWEELTADMPDFDQVDFDAKKVDEKAIEIYKNGDFIDFMNFVHSDEYQSERFIDHQSVNNACWVIDDLLHMVIMNHDIASLELILSALPEEAIGFCLNDAERRLLLSEEIYDCFRHYGFGGGVNTTELAASLMDLLDADEEESWHSKIAYDFCEEFDIETLLEKYGINATDMLFNMIGVDMWNAFELHAETGKHIWDCFISTMQDDIHYLEYYTRYCAQKIKLHNSLVVHCVGTSACRDMNRWPDHGEICCSVINAECNGTFNYVGYILREVRPNAISMTCNTDVWSHVDHSSGQRFTNWDTMKNSQYAWHTCDDEYSLINETHSYNEVWVEASKAEPIAIFVKDETWISSKIQIQSMYPSLSVFNIDTWKFERNPQGLSIDDLYFHQKETGLTPEDIAWEPLELKFDLQLFAEKSVNSNKERSATTMSNTSSSKNNISQRKEESNLYTYGTLKVEVPKNIAIITDPYNGLDQVFFVKDGRKTTLCHILDERTIIVGNVEKYVNLIAVGTRYLYENRDDRRIKLNKLTTRGETLSILLEYVSKQSDPARVVSQFAELCGKYCSDRPLSTLQKAQDFIRMHEVKLSLIDSGIDINATAIIDGGMKIRYKDLYSYNGNKGLLNFVPMHSGANQMKESYKGIPVSKLFKLIPFGKIVEMQDGSKELEVADINNARKLTARISAILNLIPADIVSSPLCKVVMVADDMPDGHGIISKNLAKKTILAERHNIECPDATEMFFYGKDSDISATMLVGDNVNMIKGLKIPVGGTIFSYVDFDNKDSEGNGLRIDMKNNYGYPVEIESFRLSTSFFNGVSIPSAVVTVRGEEHAQGGEKFRFGISNELFQSIMDCNDEKDITSSSIFASKGVFCVSKDKNLVFDTIQADAYFGLSTVKMFGGFINHMKKMSAIHNVDAPFSTTVTRNGKTMSAVVGYMELSFESLTHRRRAKLYNVSIKLSQAEQLIASVDALKYATLKGKRVFTEDEINDVTAFLKSKIDRNADAFVALLEQLGQGSLAAATMTDVEFAKIVAERGYKWLLTKENKNGINISKVSSNSLAKKLGIPGYKDLKEHYCYNRKFKSNNSAKFQEKVANAADKALLLKSLDINSLTLNSAMNKIVNAIVESGEGKRFVSTFELEELRHDLVTSLLNKAHTATSLTMFGGYFTCVIEECIKDNIIVVGAGKYTELKKRGINYILGFRQPVINGFLPTVYKVMSIAQFNRKYKEQLTFEYSPSLNDAICILGQGDADIHNADGDGDLFMFFGLPERFDGTFDIYSKADMYNHIRKAYRNVFEYRVNRWEDLNADRNKVFSSEELESTQTYRFSMEEYIEAVVDNGENKELVGPGTTAAQEAVLVSRVAVEKRLKQEYMFLAGQCCLGHLAIPYLLVQVIIDGMKDKSGNVDARKVKEHIIDAIATGKNKLWINDINFALVDPEIARAKRLGINDSIVASHDDAILQELKRLVSSIKLDEKQVRTMFEDFATINRIFNNKYKGDVAYKKMLAMKEAIDSNSFYSNFNELFISYASRILNAVPVKRNVMPDSYLLKHISEYVAENYGITSEMLKPEDNTGKYRKMGGNAFYALRQFKGIIYGTVEKDEFDSAMVRALVDQKTVLANAIMNKVYKVNTGNVEFNSVFNSKTRQLVPETKYFGNYNNGKSIASFAENKAVTGSDDSKKQQVIAARLIKTAIAECFAASATHVRNTYNYQIGIRALVELGQMPKHVAAAEKKWMEAMAKYQKTAEASVTVEEMTLADAIVVSTTAIAAESLPADISKCL